jgi:putative PIN family toxin of toxin-antitoxin system
VIRAVIDANVFLSALIRPQGPPGQVLGRLLKEKAFELVVSPDTLAELRRSLRYRNVRRYISATDEELEAWVEAVALIADVVPGELTVNAIKEDPDDNIYIAAAIEGMASTIVSGDRHLLDVQEIEGVRIVSPRQFLQMLG